MSLSPMISAIPRSHKSASDGVTIRDDESEVRHYLDALSDDDCRTILDVISADALTASEISDACDLPLSTTYRKLDVLTGMGLLEEKTRIRRSGKHANEYARTVDDIVISLRDRKTMDLLVLDLFG